MKNLNFKLDDGVYVDFKGTIEKIEKIRWFNSKTNTMQTEILYTVSFEKDNVKMYCQATENMLSKFPETISE